MAATLAAGARRRPERVHSGKFNAKSSGESEFACRATLGCKKKPLDSDGNVARYAEHGERDIGLEMGRKRRIDFADRLTVRNGVGEAKPGDKLLAAAEYEPGFYTSGGGVLAGSNFGGFNPEPKLLHRKQGRGTADAGEARLLGFGEKPPPSRAPGTYKRLTLEQRKKAQALREDIAAVTQLNPAGTGSDSSDDDDDEAVRAMHESIALGRAGAIALGSTAGDIRSGLVGAGSGRAVQTRSWEEETGCFVVKPRADPAVADAVGDAEAEAKGEAEGKAGS